MPKLKIAAISYLNTAPLMWDFEHGNASKELARSFSIQYTVPSQCAEMLASGQADVGIIPAFTYQTIPDLAIIPDVAIACKGAVRSILLISGLSLENIKTIAVDTSSRTSVALLQILFQRWWRHGGTQPRFVPCEPNLNKMLKSCDAALLIGDPALVLDHSHHKTVIDLGEEWNKRTGLPFVFAFWAVRRKALEDNEIAPRLAQIFEDSRDHGLDNVPKITAEWAKKLKIEEDVVKRYLTKDIIFDLGQEELRGLYLFYKYAREGNQIKELHRTRWLGGAMHHA